MSEDTVTAQTPIATTLSTEETSQVEQFLTWFEELLDLVPKGILPQPVATLLDFILGRGSDSKKKFENLQTVWQRTQDPNAIFKYWLGTIISKLIEHCGESHGIQWVMYLYNQQWTPIGPTIYACLKQCEADLSQAKASSMSFLQNQTKIQWQSFLVKLTSMDSSEQLPISQPDSGPTIPKIVKAKHVANTYTGYTYVQPTPAESVDVDSGDESESDSGYLLRAGKSLRPTDTSETQLHIYKRDAENKWVGTMDGPVKWKSSLRFDIKVFSMMDQPRIMLQMDGMFKPKSPLEKAIQRLQMEVEKELREKGCKMKKETLNQRANGNKRRRYF